jgi:hypothetical protein
MKIGSFLYQTDDERRDPRPRGLDGSRNILETLYVAASKVRVNRRKLWESASRAQGAQGT